MKKFIISVYIAAVLAIALMAQASSASELVELKSAHVIVSQDKQRILVVGRYPNPCISNAKIQLSAVADATVLVQVIADQKNDLCVSVLGQGFKFVLPTASLKDQLIAINADPNGQYTLVSADGRLNKVVDFSEAREVESTHDFTTMIQFKNNSSEIEPLF